MPRGPYKPDLSRSGWWLRQPRYIRYMMREMSAAFIGIYVLLLIAALTALSRGQVAYDSFLATAEGPVGIGFAVVALVFATYHTYTWFQVTPRAMPLVVRGKRVPGVVIIAAHWFGFIIVSAVLWLLVRF